MVRFDLLHRWLRAGSAADACVGAQWLGDRLVLARVRAGSPPTIERVDEVAAEPARRADVLRDLASRGALRGARVVLVLAPAQYDIHPLAAPAVPDEELRDALRWQLRGTLAYAPEEAVLDFARVPQAAEVTDPARRPLLVVVAQKSVIEAAVAPFVAADVGVDAVDVPEFAQRNLASYLAGQSETSAWLGFERDTCLLTAHAGGELAFARRMLLPGAVSHALDADLPAVSEHVSDRVVTQVQRTLEQFERQSGLPSVAQVTVGPYLHARAIAHLLAERAALRTQVFDPAAVFEHAPGVDLVSYPLALTALGGALRMESEADSSSAGWLARLFARQPQPAPVAQTA